MVADSAPKLFQLTPSVEYCQVPLPVTQVTAIPFCAPLSTSAQLAAVRIALIAVADEVLFSSVALRAMVEPLLNVGASLTALTVIEALSVAAEKAVLPPLTEVSTLLPAVPLTWSQARNDSVALVAFCASGTKRSRSVPRNSNADVSLTTPSAFQVLPLLLEYSQVPLPLVSAITAMPCSAPASASLMPPPRMAATDCPPLLVWFSLMPLNTGVATVSTGASLTAPTAMVALADWVE